MAAYDRDETEQVDMDELLVEYGIVSEQTLPKHAKPEQLYDDYEYTDVMESNYSDSIQTDAQARPIYNVFILPANERQITHKDVERLIPLGTIGDDIHQTQDFSSTFSATLDDLMVQTGKFTVNNESFERPEPEEETKETKKKKEASKENKKKEKKKEKKLSHLLGEIAFYVVLVVFILMVFILKGSNGGKPSSFAGFSVFTVLTGSMESEIPQGSLVVSREVDPLSLQIGDDITYLANPTTTITHRIIGITENYENTGQRAFQTQGIMNEQPDKLPVVAANVVGKVVFHNYFLGQIASFVSQYWLILIILLVLTIGFFTALKAAFAKDDEEEEEEDEEPIPEKKKRSVLKRKKKDEEEEEDEESIPEKKKRSFIKRRKKDEEEEEDS